MRIQAVAVALLCSITCHAQSEFRDEARRFHLTIPTGWTSSPELLEFTIDTLADHAIQGKFTYLAAFVLEGEPKADSPYVILQYTPANFAGASYEAIEQELNATSFQATIKEKAEEVKDLIGQITIGKPVLDRSTNRVYIRMATDADQAGQVWHGMAAMTLANHGMIQINSYAVQGTKNDPAQIVQQFLGGLRLDSGSEFIASPHVSATTRALKGGMNGAIQGGIIGITIGAVMGVITWLKNRKK